MSKYEYRRRKSRRRRSRFNRHLPTFIALLLLLVLLGAAIFLVSRFVFHKKPGQSSVTEVVASPDSTPPSASTPEAPTEPQPDEIDQLIAKADRLAAGYDYDAAIALVEGDEKAAADPRGQEAVKGYQATRETPVSYTHLDVYKRQGKSCPP